MKPKPPIGFLPSRPEGPRDLEKLSQHKEEEILLLRKEQEEGILLLLGSPGETVSTKKALEVTIGLLDQAVKGVRPLVGEAFKSGLLWGFGLSAVILVGMILAKG